MVCPLPVQPCEQSPTGAMCEAKNLRSVVVVSVTLILATAQPPSPPLCLEHLRAWALPHLMSTLAGRIPSSPAGPCAFPMDGQPKIREKKGRKPTYQGDLVPLRDLVGHACHTLHVFMHLFRLNIPLVCQVPISRILRHHIVDLFRRSHGRLSKIFRYSLDKHRAPNLAVCEQWAPMLAEQRSQLSSVGNLLHVVFRQQCLFARQWKLRLKNLQPDLRFGIATLVSAMRDINRELHLWPRRECGKHLAREALALSTMCSHVWAAAKGQETWLSDLGLAHPVSCSMAPQILEPCSFQQTPTNLVALTQTCLPAWVQQELGIYSHKVRLPSTDHMLCMDVGFE